MAKKPEPVLSGRVKASLNDDGSEKLDPTPIAIPVELRRPESMDQRIAKILAHSLAVAKAGQEIDSFADADDFDIPDDPIDPSTPWEEDFDHASIAAMDRGLVAKPPEVPVSRISELKRKYFPKLFPAKQAPLRGAEPTGSQGAGAGAPAAEGTPNDG